MSLLKIIPKIIYKDVQIGVNLFAALGFELWQGTVAGAYLKTIANLGSLLPSALLAYYIYRYRYLEIIIEKSLVVFDALHQYCRIRLLEGEKPELLALPQPDRWDRIRRELE